MGALTAPRELRHPIAVERHARLLAGWCGVGTFVIFVLALPLYFLGASPGARLEDTALFSDYVAKTNLYIVVRTAIADPLILVGLLVFLSGFRQLVRGARPDFEWIGTLVLAGGAVLATVVLVGDGLEAGAALDTWVKADPTATRTLFEASFPFYGTIGLILEALVLALAGGTTLATRVLPRWTAWFAFATALASVLAAPAILGGANMTGFYTVSGFAPFIAQAGMVAWFFAASVSLLVKREATWR